MIALKIIGAIIAIPLAFIIFSNALQTFLPAWLATVVAIIAALTILALIFGARPGLDQPIHVAKKDFGKIVGPADSISIDVKDLQ